MTMSMPLTTLAQIRQVACLGAQHTRKTARTRRGRSGALIRLVKDAFNAKVRVQLGLYMPDSKTCGNANTKSYISTIVAVMHN